MYEPGSQLGRLLKVLVEEIGTSVNPQAFVKTNVEAAFLEADGYVEIENYPTLGGMGGGSGSEMRLQDAWERRFGPPPGEPGSKVVRDGTGRCWMNALKE